MGGEGIVIMFETIGTEDGEATFFEPGDKFVDNGVGHGLGARSELDDGDEFGLGVADGPDPDILPGILEIRPELIELDMDKLKSSDEMVVEFAAMITAAGEPGAQGDFAHFECVSQSVDVDAACQEGERKANDFGVRLDTIEDSMFAAGELGLAGLAEKILNEFILAMSAIADQSMHFLIGDKIIVAILVGAEVVLGADLLFLPFSAFDFGPGDGCFGAGGMECRSSIKRCAALRAIQWGFGAHHLGFAGFGSTVFEGE